MTLYDTILTTILTIIAIVTVICGFCAVVRKKKQRKIDAQKHIRTSIDSMRVNFAEPFKKLYLIKNEDDIRVLWKFKLNMQKCL